MISSDKNVEIIVQLLESLKKWAGVKAELLKIEAADKGIRVIAAFIFIMMFMFFMFSISILLALALAVAIASYTGMAWAFVIMAVVYLVFFLATIAFRKKLIVNPLVKFFALLLEAGTPPNV
ncbi:MAG: phage holin family protein [Bacteroidaceae bacterium]|nr:phage holin family protein [Bacteroidaceae bacterium]